MTQRILFFIESGGPGGAEQVVLTLASELKRQNIPCAVATLRSGWFTEELRSKGIPHYLIKSQRRLDFSLPFRLAKLAKKTNSTLLHTHLLDSNFYGAFAARIARIPHLATEHGDVHHIQRKRFARTKLFFLRLFKTPLVSVSHYSGEKLLKLGLKKESLHIIRNPLHLQEKFDLPQRIHFRESLGISQDVEHWIWVHIANLRPVKDQATLLQAFALAQKTISTPQTLYILGEGKERKKLETLAEGLGIVQSVKFLGFRNDTSKYLAAADGFVLSSLSESMPMSLLEAASHGLVTLCTEVGGISEIIQNNKTGILVPKKDPQALGQAMAKRIEDKSGSKQLGTALQKQIKHQCSPESISNQYQKLYKELSS